MKKLFVLSVVLLIVVVGVMVSEEYGYEKVQPVINDITQAPTIEKVEDKESEKIYAVWLTYSEIGTFVKNKSEAEYKESVENIFTNLKENKINTVFYQCRAFCDSFYHSEIFPVSKYIKQENKSIDFDPFEIFLEAGEKHRIKIHCWVNPYRVSYDNAFENLPKNSPARMLYNGNKNALIICDKGIFLNPAVPESRKLVFDGIRELLEKYKVDGIHFDDYFYPESDEINDSALYEKYKKSGGALTLSQWRCENVSALISGVYALVKSYDQALVFSVSPAADIEKCKSSFYADVEKWCREDGYADYIIPQIYFGFENEKMPFKAVVGKWQKLAEKGSVKLVCGLAAYKCGSPDENAGSGKNEWQENVNILSQQFEQISGSQTWQGFSLFSYSYCFGENVNEFSKKEIKNLLYMVE